MNDIINSITDYLSGNSNNDSNNNNDSGNQEDCLNMSNEEREKYFELVLGSVTGPAGKAKVIFPKAASEFKKFFGVTREYFHREIKSSIVTDLRNDAIYQNSFLRMGKNPDFGIDELGNIWVKDVRTRELMQTDIPFSSYLP
ncbi:MAG: hypothetical protein PHT78_12615 [Desulfitobacteriaceae bacterium]|nr:hypothetical protein [Desulfitobacteriaceae bacterium]